MGHAHEAEPFAAVEFRVLGALEVRRHAHTVSIGSERQRTLLAALLADAGSVVSVDALTEALWGGSPPPDPRNAIQTYVARLRGVLGPGAPLVTRSPGYTLAVGSEEVDAIRFEQLLTEAERRRQHPDIARELLDEALVLWRGRAYAEFAEGVARAEALRLEERRLVALEQRAAHRLVLGEAAWITGELEALAIQHPLRERFAELRMRTLAALGRNADALEAYRAYRELLVDETGLEPSPSLSELESRILQGDVAEGDREDDTKPASSRVSADPDVPPAKTSCVGRAEEIATTREALNDHRLVTLTGPGGVGKTRIAAEVAAAPHHGDVTEVAWVDLASLADRGAVPHVVAAAVGMDLSGNERAREELVSSLAGRRLLLVFDNAEHLLEAVAPLADALQRHCRSVRMLATSRERLAIDGERVLPVDPLPTDAVDVHAEPPAAVRLFLERAATAGGKRSADLPLVAEICRKLEGLPLAIELAAARTGALSLEELLTALDDDAPTALGMRRSEPKRHRDLWSVVDWSYQLLDDTAKRLFERLSVFAGAFGVDEAHAVCAPEGQRRTTTIEQLATLTEGSLLTRPLSEHAPSPHRHRMLRPVRAFARQRLADRGQTGQLADRHAALIVERAELATGPPLTDQGRRWLEASLDDLRAVRRRALLRGDVSLLGRLVAAVYRFDYWRPGSELLGWADDALEWPDAATQATAPQVHAAAATAAWMAGDLERARQLATRAAALGAGPDDPARTLAFEALADVAFFEGRLSDAEDAFREVVRLARRSGDPDGRVNGLAGISLALAYTGRPAEGAAIADDADRAATHAGPALRAFSRYAQGECRAETEPDAAVALVEEAASLAKACNAWFIEGVARLTAASVRARDGDLSEAVSGYADLLRHWRRSGNWMQQWTVLRNLVELLVELEAEEPAVVIAAAAEVEETAAPTFGTESARLERALAAARERLGHERFEAARRRGRGLRGHEAVDLALATVDQLSHRADDEKIRQSWW